MKESLKNKKNILLIITILFLVTIVFGAAYSYLSLYTNKAEGNIVAISGSTDSLMFMADKDINLHVTKDTLSEGAGNLHDEMKVTAKLVPNNTTKRAQATYNGFFVIDNNSFNYTTKEKTPEILLKVTDPNGVEVTNIEGLRYVGNGFDITNRTGGFLIRSDYEIETNQLTGTIQEWKIEVTFVNLETNQAKNAGKDFSGKVYFTQDKISTYRTPKINTVNTRTTYNTIDAEAIIVPGTGQVDKYHFALREKDRTEEFDYSAGGSNRFLFSNLKDNTTYRLSVYVEDVHGIISNIYETDVTTDVYDYPVVSDVLISDIGLFGFTVTATGQGGTNDIESYLFSIDDGETFVESESSVYTFDDLNDSSTYRVKVKIKDTIGKESNEYFKEVSTKVYVNPSVVRADIDASYNSIEVGVTAEGGTNDVSKYLFRKSTDANWIEVDGNNYTFTGLNESQSYTLYVKVRDSFGRESAEYEITDAQTRAYNLPKILNASVTPDETSLKIDVTGQNGDGTITSYKYSRDGGSNWYSRTSNSYTFNNLTSSTTFQIWVKVVDSNGRESMVFKTEGTTLDAGLCPKGTNLAECVKSQYTSQGSNNLYYHTSTLANSAQDGNYRYAGAPGATNNWICFGTSDKDECLATPNTYLYKIIGKFGNQVKLVRNRSYKMTYWPGVYSSAATNAWADSTLNTKVLNETYLSEIGTEWANRIAFNNWQVGSVNASYTSNVAYFYPYELGSKIANKLTYNSKVAMMYVSDYGYGASPENWTTRLDSYGTTSIRNNNCVVNPVTGYELLLTPYSTIYTYLLGNTGNLTTSTVRASNVKTGMVRPTFYLNSDIQFGSGMGTSTDPIMIYDDGYIYPKINIQYTTSSSSISLAGTVTKGTANLSKVMTSFDGGSTWESTSLGSESSYSYTSSKVNLPSNTNYQVWVKVVDVNGRESDIVKMSITTDYVLPVVDSVQVSGVTESGFTVTANATGGSGTLKTYYFSTNGGSTYSSVASTANSASKTFTGLAGGTTYNIKVYVKDSNSKSSEIYSTSASTSDVGPSITNLQITNITTSGFTVTATAKAGSGALKTYYFSTNGGSSYSSVSSTSTSVSKSFTGLSSNQTYNISVYVMDANNLKSTTRTTTATTAKPVSRICTEGVTLASCIKSQYTSQGSKGIYYHTSSLSNGAGDNSYRYAGGNVNNYVCFGSNESNCPSNNLYRIIGVIDNKVKLVKEYGYDVTAWNSTTTNAVASWSTSSLNSKLNSTYLSSLGTTWSNKIATSTYYVGGVSLSVPKNSVSFYKYEVGSEADKTKYVQKKIGVPYISDYVFASSPTIWTQLTGSYTIANTDNWMKWSNTQSFWLITPCTDSNDYVWYILGLNGNISQMRSTYATELISRPAFYLNSSVTYVSGTGSSTDPMIIN